MQFIDTHAHLYVKEFDEDRFDMVQRAIDSNVYKIYLPNIDLNSVSGMIALCKQFPEHCFPLLGLHPCDVKQDYIQILKEMDMLFSDHPFMGIGETGTDAYWDVSHMAEQIISFEWHIQWAKNRRLPIIIHSRETLDQNIDIITKHQDGTLSGIFHCFGGTTEQAKKIMDLGFYLGIGGTVTYKNSGLDLVLPKIGLSNVVLETDAPFLSPVPFRGKRNESSFIVETAKKVAEYCSMPLEEVAQQTTQNALAVYKC